MKPQDIDSMLRQTLDDGRLSRGERDALGQVFDELPPDTRAMARNRAFDLVRDRLDGEAQGLLTWLERVVKLSVPKAVALPSISAAFSPGEDCRNRIATLLRGTRRRLDICVFTITDDFLSKEIVKAHERGVAVRVITDDDKAHDKGNDARALARAGVPVRFDLSEAHMHHKFALFDGRTLLNGSYNWTRSAFTQNEENVVVGSDERLVAVFQEQFDKMWAQFG